MIDNIVVTSPVSVVLVAVVTALLLLYAAVGNVIPSSSSGNQGAMPPGPTGLPIIGSMLKVAGYPFKQFFEWSKEYGPVITVKMGPTNWVVLNNYESYHEAFVKQKEQFSGRPTVNLFEQFMNGKGIILRNGAFWKVQRDFGVSAFHGEGIKKRDIEKLLLEETKCFISEIAANGEKPQDIKVILSSSILNALCRILFGKGFDKKDPVFQDILEKNNYYFEPGSSTYNQILLMRLFFGLRHIPPFSWANAAMLERTKNVLDHINDIIKDHKDTFDESNIRDFVDEFLLNIKNVKDPSFTEGQLAQLILDIVVGAVAGQTNTYRWALISLLHFPEWQEKIYNEITALGAPVQFSLKTKMPCTRAFIQESHRFRPAIPLSVNHMVTEDVHFKGFTIPSNTQVVGNNWAVNHDPEVWQDPEKFRPDRFLDSSGEFVHLAQLIPHGIGPRYCFAAKASEILHFHFLTALVQKFKVSAAKKLPSLEDSIFGTSNNPLPFEVIVKERQ